VVTKFELQTHIFTSQEIAYDFELIKNYMIVPSEKRMGLKIILSYKKSSIELIIIKIVNVSICGLLYFNLSDRWGYRDHPSYFFLVFLEATTYCGLTH
jgi:hypothetical protein